MLHENLSVLAFYIFCESMSELSGVTCDYIKLFDWALRRELHFVYAQTWGGCSNLFLF